MVLEGYTLQVMATKIKFHSRCSLWSRASGFSWICHAFRQVGNLIFIDFHSWSKKMGLVWQNRKKSHGERLVSITFQAIQLSPDSNKSFLKILLYFKRSAILFKMLKVLHQLGELLIVNC